jgi:hypothetical protein
MQMNPVLMGQPPSFVRPAPSSLSPSSVNGNANPNALANPFSYTSSLYGRTYGSAYQGGYGALGGYGGYGGSYGGGAMSASGYGSSPYLTSYYGDYYGSSGTRGRYQAGEDGQGNYEAKPEKAKRSDLFYEDPPAARRMPTTNEILAGAALNDLLADLGQARARGRKPGPATFPVPLDEEEFTHINVARGAGNIALIKNGGRLQWPAALNTPALEAEREALSSLCSAAVRQAEFNGSVDAGTLAALDSNALKLTQELRQEAGRLSPPEYIEAKVFLHNLDDAIAALHMSDVGNHFTGVYALKAKTLPELVLSMQSHNLRFARALPGDEKAYVNLYSALNDYGRSLQPQ